MAPFWGTIWGLLLTDSACDKRNDRLAPSMDRAWCRRWAINRRVPWQCDATSLRFHVLKRVAAAWGGGAG
jgi:hypothetical protein